MTHIRRPFAIAAIVLELAGVVATSALASGHSYRAVCETWSCRWVGPPRTDLYEAFLDAHSHGTKIGHQVKIEGLLRDRAPINTADLSATVVRE